jgi:Beta-lactamase class C and other penicillin binding proteins
MYTSQVSTIAIYMAGMGLFGACIRASPTLLPSWTGCPVNGPLLPRPTDLGNSQIIQNATAKLAHALDLSIRGERKAGFQVDNTSFSLALVSPYTPDSDHTGENIIWSYHHLGKNNVQGTNDLGDDSQYMIGSISKVFSDLILLQSDLDLNDPITRYLPELEREGTPIQWSNITLSALSNHLAGIPSNLR